MIRKHTRFIPHLSKTDILFNWTESCRVGAELSLLAEELSQANQFPAAEVVLGMGKIFGDRRFEVSKQAMHEFAGASRSAYRTEHSAYIVQTSFSEVTKRKSTHVFLKFFRKSERQPFHTTQVVVDEDGYGQSFASESTNQEGRVAAQEHFYSGNSE